MTKQPEILLASDFSARSDRPLARALALATARGARLAIAHVVKDDSELSPERLRADLPPEASDAELVVRAGRVPETLATIASERGSDLIVAGVARYNDIGDYLLGTAVDHIVRHASAPLLVVRRPAHCRYDHMVVATDFSDCATDALLLAARLFPDAAITLTHAFHVPYGGWLKSDDVAREVRQDAEARMQDYLRLPALGPLLARITPLAAQGETASVVIAALRETGANLLALGTHGRSGFVQAAIGSQAETLLRTVDCDVLMVRAGGRP